MHNPLPEVGPVIVGELTCRDRFGGEVQPETIYFCAGDSQQPGLAYAKHFSDIYGSSLLPVVKSNGEKLRFEGYAGLCCRYDRETGTIKEFYEE